MSQYIQNKQPRPFKGYHLAIIMVCFFGAIFAVNLTMAFIASHNWTGLVVKNSYVASQGFNAHLEAAKVQKSKGWNSNLTYQEGFFTVTLLDEKGTLLEAASVKAMVGRPAFEQKDHALTFISAAKGVYQAKDILDAGLWVIRLEADINGEPYRRHERIFVDAIGRGTIQ